MGAGGLTALPLPNVTRVTVAVLLALSAALLLPATGLASTTIDILGTWNAQGQGGGAYTITFTGEDCSTGVISGSASGGIGPETGTLNGSQIMLHESYGGYTSDITATVANNASMAGQFHDSNNLTAPWNATRTSGPPSNPPPGCSGATTSTTSTTTTTTGGRPSATSVQCNYDEALQSFDCTAQVADASGKQPSQTPTGSVAFTQDPGSNGGFPYGSTCTLQPSQSGPTAYCTVTYVGAFDQPPGTQPPITGTFSGDATFASSSGRPMDMYAAPPETTTTTTATTTESTTSVESTTTEESTTTTESSTTSSSPDDFCAPSANASVFTAWLATTAVCHKRDPADAVGRAYEIKGHAYIQEGKDGPIRELKKEDLIFPDDHIITDANSVAAFELLIGGRIGVKQGTEVVVLNEGEVAGVDPTTGDIHKIALRSGGMWAKFAKQKEPLTIQTRGGVMGIKG